MMRRFTTLFAAIGIACVSVTSTQAVDPALSGSVIVNFGYHPTASPPYWSFDGITNTMSLTIPPVFDLTVAPAAIGPTVNWSDKSTWTRPALDLSGFSLGQTGSGSYTAVVNDGQSTLDTLVSSGYGPSEGVQNYVEVKITNVQPAGQSPGAGTNTLHSNFVTTSKFNVTIPAGALVAPPPNFAAPTLENLTIQSGGSLTGMAANSRVRQNLTNHGSGNFYAVVEGNFINDALTANGDIAIVGGIVEVQGQLQNTGELQIANWLRLKTVTSNVGSITVNTNGTLYLDTSFTNSGNITLSGGSISGAAAGAVVNNGNFHWSGGSITTPLVNNSSMTITGSETKRFDVTLTSYGNITQSSANGPGIVQLVNEAGATYDITSDGGLEANFGAGAATNYGLFRKAGGMGTSRIAVPFTNFGTLAINSGKLWFSASSNPLTLNPSSTLLFQLNGLATGTGFGKLDLSFSTLNLAGALAVTLNSGFVPALGNSFDLLDFGTTTGAFSSLQLPPLASGLKWNASQLYTTGVLSVAAGLPGDYNQNGVVDAPDYVVWRKHLGTTYTSSDLDTWRANLGRTSGSGSFDADSFSAIPEPATFGLVVLTSFALHSRRRRA